MNDADNDARSPAKDSPPLSAGRLASLSDGMFGVAMTLLVTTLVLPMQTLSGSVPGVFAQLGRSLSPVVLSFSISGLYWLAQQRQLALTRTLAPLQTLLHFVFLFLIVLLPITTALSSRGVTSEGAVQVYGTHLALLALVNLLLWLQMRRVAPRGRIVGSALTLASLIVALVVGTVRPAAAPYFWYAGFVLPWIGRNLTRTAAKS